jgi:hypothetical protein
MDKYIGKQVYKKSDAFPQTSWIVSGKTTCENGYEFYNLSSLGSISRSTIATLEELNSEYTEYKPLKERF